MYENNWESLNQRQVPEWFEDAKFGIFIHWGLYSVPAYAPKGCYAEWYGCHCDTEKDDEIQRKYYEHRKNTYGENFRYSDFVKDFKAECFDAKEWIKLFEEAGARYMNLVSKHHDGFCMYKSDLAPNWNSYDVGPHKDFCLELSEACKNSKVKFGVYHSVYEWFHPLYLKDPEEYSIKHLIPMLKELVEKYKPHTLFTDGEWEHPSSTWHSTDFLQWLYNESSVKDIIVPNDRWGSETRGRLGGNLTTEYGEVSAADGSLEVIDRVSEECRGIGASFGFNKYERLEDYLSPKALIDMFVDLISRGSNFLLNIGPTADGRIPIIMEERLRQIGAWLRVNGEAVYASRKYCEAADKSIRYTQSKDHKTIYAFLMKYPFGEIVFDEIPYCENYKISLLGYDGELKPLEQEGKLKLCFDKINPDDLQRNFVYTIKIAR